MNLPLPSYSRDQMVAFLTAWMKQSPSMSYATALEEGHRRGFTVGPRDYEEARRSAAGLPPLEAAGAERGSSTATARQTWLTGFLRANPTATFATVKDAAKAAGYPKPSPISFGMARKAAGLSSMKVPGSPVGRFVASGAIGRHFAELRRALEDGERLAAALRTVAEVISTAGIGVKARSRARLTFEL